MTDKYFQPVQPQKECRGPAEDKAQPGKGDHRQRKPHGRRQNQNQNQLQNHALGQGQHHHRAHQTPSGGDDLRLCSTAEGGSNHRCHDTHHHGEKADPYHPHHHHHHQHHPPPHPHPQKHHHVADGVSHSSSTSTSSSSCSSSSSSSSSTSSSSNSSSSSSSSSFSSSESSDSSEDERSRGKPKHSRSCLEISRGRGLMEEEDNNEDEEEEEEDRRPLMEDAEGHGRQGRSAMERRGQAAPSSHHSLPRGGQGRSRRRRDGCGARTSSNGACLRKSKSLEAFSNREHGDGQENEGTREAGRGHVDSHRTALKEKGKFSAFLNEITRQVLSPLRLTSLGVTDAAGPRSPGTGPGPGPGPGPGRTCRVEDRPEEGPGHQSSIHSGSSSPESARSQLSNHSRSGRRPLRGAEPRKHKHRGHPCPPGDVLGHTHRSPAGRCGRSDRRHHSCSSLEAPSSPRDDMHPQRRDGGEGGSHSHKEDERGRSRHERHHGDRRDSRNQHRHGDRHHGESRSLPKLQDVGLYGASDADGIGGVLGDHRHGDGCSLTLVTSRRHHHHHHHHHRDQQNNHKAGSSHHHGSRGPNHDHRDDGSQHPEHHHHGDHPHGDHPQGQSHHRQHRHLHGDKHSPTHHHHHGDHHPKQSHHHHRRHDNHPHSPSHQHHHGDNQSPTYHHHGDHHSPTHHHDGSHSNEHNHHHHHGDKHSPTHHHGHHYSPTHHQDDPHSNEHHHHHGDKHSPTYHHGDHHSPTHHHDSPNSKEHHHHHGDKHRPTLPNHHDNHPNHPHETQSKASDSDFEKGSLHASHHPQHQQPRSQSHHHHHHHHHHQQHHHNTSPADHPHCQDAKHSSHANIDPKLRHPDPCKPPHPHNPHTENYLLRDQEPPRAPPAVSSSSQEEEQGKASSCLVSAPPGNNMAQEQTRIILLQEQNVDLHHSLMQTASRMECLGDEFMSSHQVLEGELQRTRVELSHLTDKFKRLQDNYSSTQQTNNLLEHRLQSVAQHMEGERERLNHRITALTDQLAIATPDPGREMLQVTSSQHWSLERHFPKDDPAPRFALPMALPPPQFTDDPNYGPPKSPGQNQSLLSVPEEEESDWSEMGDDAPRFRLGGGAGGGGRVQAGFLPWRRGEGRRGGWPYPGDGEGDSESGGEEFVRRHPAGALHLPLLHLTLRSQAFPPPPGHALRVMADGQGAPGEQEPHGSSPLRLRSASLGEIPGACHREEEEEAQQEQEEEQQEVLMRRGAAGGERYVTEDSDNEIIHRWRPRADGDPAGGRGAVGSEVAEDGGGLAGLHSAQRMLNQFICELRPGEGRRSGLVAVPVPVEGWTGGRSEEVLGVDRTQL